MDSGKLWTWVDLLIVAFRYEIANGDAAWEDAERLVDSKKTTSVAVKSSKPSKRKAGETAGDIYEKEIASREPTTKHKKRKERT